MIFEVAAWIYVLSAAMVASYLILVFAVDWIVDAEIRRSEKRRRRCK